MNNENENFYMTLLFGSNFSIFFSSFRMYNWRVLLYLGGNEGTSVDAAHPDLPFGQTSARYVQRKCPRRSEWSVASQSVAYLIDHLLTRASSSPPSAGA